ncbi:MAG TPA: hypothetical protein VM433_06900 [Mycobacteriales bacterium]|nr:hypothetical protein [Mycobacteriales bacterium]
MPESLPRLALANGATALLAVSMIVLSTLAAYFAASLQPTTYGAQVEVLYELSGGGQEADRELATQEVLLSSRVILAPVAEELGVPLRELAGSQDVGQVADSQVLRTVIGNEDPQLAVRLAQAVAERYVQAAGTRPVPDGMQDPASLQARIADLNAEAAAVRAELGQLAADRVRTGQPAGAPLTPAERALQAQDESLAGQIRAAQDELRLVQQSTARARILTPAYLLDEPLGPRPVRAGAAGAMVGIVLAGALVLLVARQRTVAATP